MVSMQSDQLGNNFQLVVADLLFFSSYSELSDAIDDLNFHSEDLVNDFLLFSRGSKLYDQIRIIDARGNEVVRVNLLDGVPVAVPKGETQFKGSRYYFKETYELDQGEVFISPFDLNMEHGKIEQPLKPMIRFATPIFDKDGEKQGIIIFNYLGKYLIHEMKDVVLDSPGFYQLLNSDGYWIIGMEPKDEWGFMYQDGKGRMMGSMYPDIWAKISVAESGQFYNEQGLITFSSVYPFSKGWESSVGVGGSLMPIKNMKSAKDQPWRVVSLIPQNLIVEEHSNLLSRYIYMFICVVMVVMVGSWLLALAILRRKFAEQMLKESHDNLERKVDERSRDLRNSNKEKEERIKELNCIYGITNLIKKEGSLSNLFESVVSLIPAGWKYPESTRCKIVFDAEIYAGGPFTETEWKQTEALIVNGKKRGSVEVYYLKKQPILYEGPFLKEERALIKEVACAIQDAIERKEAEDLFKQQQYFLTKAQALGGIGFWDLDIQTNKLTWTDENYHIFGLPVGKKISYEMFLSCIYPEDRMYVDKEWKAGLKNKFYDVEHRIVTPDGDVKWVREKADFEFDKNGNCVRGTGFTQDITALKEADKVLRFALEEKEILLKEVHHRVKNNLIVLEGLLTIQQKELVDEQVAVKALETTKQRIRAMVKVQKLLHQSKSLSDINFGKYIEVLLNELSLAGNAGKENITIFLDLEPINFDLDIAMPCGLIVNELISNVFKHAFPDSADGRLDISLKKKNGRIELCVRDNGVGMPEEYIQGDVKTLGLKLVVMFTHQIKGEVLYRRNNGSEFTIVFKMDKSSK